MSKFIQNAANSLISLAEILCLCLAGAYALFALWDNQSVYAAAENVQADMLKLKPSVEEAEDGGASFAELLAINPDVCAWLTLDNTGVDCPVLQGDTNLTYINTNVYGDFALAGSIYLDSRNDNTFSNSYSLLYGHHMDNGSMFGDLDLFEDAAFFGENTTGMLLLPNGAYKLEIFACLLVPASEKNIFEPERWQTDIDGLLAFVKDNSLHLHEEIFQKLEGMDQPKVLAMSTCSSEFTDARTIILAVMVPSQAADQEED